MFLENRCCESSALLTVVNEIFLYFLRFSRDFGKIRRRLC